MDKSIIFISGPITSEDYARLNKLILTTKRRPKVVGIGHCVIGTGIWPFFNSSFLKDLPKRLNFQNLIAGCPPHPKEIEEVIKTIVKL
ncbi:MAG: NADH-quinone oxidoreductase subunit B family protein [Candidatus Hodarchaeales archaeon]